ncbi:MAG: hypothetical protein ACO3C1_03695 [Ilumatobacteraceae bacterium]
MATSSAKKVAKLASRGKGKKVRFASGTTFPVVVASVSVVMIALIAYGKVSMPPANSGAPQPGDEWTMAYEFRVCDDTFTLEGSPADLTDQQASAGDREQLSAGQSNSAGFINYHPTTGGDTGRKATLGVFLDVYGVELSSDGLVIPAAQAGGAEDEVYNLDDPTFFDGTSCEGEDPQLKVRVWDDASTDDFQDNITAFRDLRFTDNGMAFVIAIVPEGKDIPKPDTWTRLSEFGVIGSGSSTVDSTTPSDSTSPSDTTAPGDTTADTVADTTAPATTAVDTTAPATTEPAPTTTGG